MTEPPRPWRGRRILVVSHDYAPDHVGIAPYATEIAQWLVSCGAEVDVLTMPSHYPSWRRDPHASRWYHRENLDGVTVHRLPTYIPARPTLLRRLLFEGSWLISALGMVGRRFVRNADLVIAINPGIFASAYAAVIARRRPLIQMVQDLVGQAASQSGMSGAARAAQALGRVEAWSLRAADRVTVAAPGFIAPLAARGVDPGRIRIVPNWSRLPAPAAGAGELGHTSEPDGRFVVLHAGNMGLKQGLDLLGPVIAAAETRAPHIQFRFLGEGSQADALRAIVDQHSNAEILPYVPEEELLATVGAADALLVHERPTVKDMSLPSKLTTYFAAGRPVIAVVRPDGSTATEVRRSGGGIVVEPGDPTAFLDAVQSLRDEPEYAAEIGRKGREHSRQHLSREASLTTIAELIDGTLSAT